MNDSHGAEWAALRFQKVIKEEIDSGALGDVIEWDFSPVIYPSGEPGGQPACGYVLILSCRSPLISPPRIAVYDATWDAAPSDHDVRQMVIKAIEALYKVRAGLTRLPNAQGPN